MNLRLRLLAAMGTVLALVAVGGFTVVRSQRSFLIDQVDEQLAAAMPFTRPPPRRDLDVTNAELVPPTEAPISSLYVGFFDSGELTPLLQGQLIDDSPDVSTDAAELERLIEGPTTVDGVSGSSSFRLRVTSVPQNAGYLVVALPLDEVDSAVRRLELVLLLVGALVLVALAAALWWVERLGISPIRRVTGVAEAISAGDRSQRVDGVDERTEAGKLAGAFNLMLDERDMIERRRRQFVADASHELRTPLTSIRGYLELYAQGRFVDRQQVDDMVRRMSGETERMKDLVEDLLLLANLDLQRPLREDVVDLGQIVADAAGDARAVQPHRSVTVDLPDSPVETIGDRFRLQQVVSALLDNALTHTGLGTRIDLAARTTGAGTEIVVADDGPGLSAELAGRVFDRFARGDEARTRSSGNSGLGLAIARSIVEAHGGTIELETAPGRGCTFTITLPERRTSGGPVGGDGAEAAATVG